MYIDQREPGLEFERNYPNWTNKFKTEKEKENIGIKETEYNFINIKKFPESRKDVLFPHIEKIDFHHRMDALKYCNDNKIGFLWWNDVMYDLEGNTLDIGYYDLKD